MTYQSYLTVYFYNLQYLCRPETRLLPQNRKARIPWRRVGVRKIFPEINRL